MSDRLSTASIRLPDGTNLSEFLLRKLAAPSASSGSRTGPTVVCVGGYPFTGKTALAAELAARWPAHAYVLPTESAILSRRERLARALDGSNVDAHDTAGLVRTLSRIIAGHAVDVGVYSWTLGACVGVAAAPILGDADLLIMDGSISTASPILDHCDIAVVLRPANVDEWLRRAVDRDVRERSWGRSDAIVQNRAKAQSVDDQICRTNCRPNCYKVVLTSYDLPDWTATVA